MNHPQFTVRGLVLSEVVGAASPLEIVASPTENEITLAARAEKLGETALLMGLIPSLPERHFQG